MGCKEKYVPVKEFQTLGMSVFF